MSGITIKGDVTFSDLKTGKQIKLADRNAIIEECAKEADSVAAMLNLEVSDSARQQMIAAIRALKDKTP